MDPSIHPMIGSEKKKQFVTPLKSFQIFFNMSNEGAATFPVSFELRSNMRRFIAFFKSYLRQNIFAQLLANKSAAIFNGILFSI